MQGAAETTEAICGSCYGQLCEEDSISASLTKAGSSEGNESISQEEYRPEEVNEPGDLSEFSA